MDEPSFNTPTMAELFAAQGKPARAVGILRHVAQRRPDDVAVARRLAELEAQVGAATGAKVIFRERMRELVDAIDGATACALMGFDGIAIDSYEVGGSGLDIPVLLAEYAAAAQSLRQSGQTQPLAGAMRELSVTTENLTAVFYLLNDAYYLAVLLEPLGLAGKARFLLRQAAPEFIAELG